MKYPSRKIKKTNLTDATTDITNDASTRRDHIMNDPAFARTRENMSEFGACGIAVKAIRLGFNDLLPDNSDLYFTARLMKLVKEVNRRDFEGLRGKRSIRFSANRIFLQTLRFKVVYGIISVIESGFRCSHPVSRTEATLALTDLAIKPVCCPMGATHFRIQHHLSIISDYMYAEDSGRYEPLSPNNGLSTSAFSEYTPVNVSLTEVIRAAFPADTLLTDAASVIQAIGIVFFVKSAGDVYLAFSGCSMIVYDVF